MIKIQLLIAVVLCVGCETAVYADSRNSLFNKEKFTENDAVLVVDQAGDPLFSWQADKLLIPASLTKLMTAQLAIDKWGLDHRFVTDFYLVDKDLWVKGYGDPFLVSEELDLVVAALKQAGVDAAIDSINIDSHYFDVTAVPGRSLVSDPYNAPLSAVAANFNTAKLRLINGEVRSAEKQTPLTPTAKKMSGVLKAKTERVNLVNANNAQLNFAELLLAKLSTLTKLSTTATKKISKEPAKANVQININKRLPEQARLIYRHKNSHTLADVLRGTLEYSNNFIANQLFLKLADQTDAANVASKPKPVSFSSARRFVSKQISKRDKFSTYDIFEGAGLSRKNRLSALQIDDLLESLYPHQSLLKRVENKSFNTKGVQAKVFAKTGTLDGVRTYAGYISLLGTQDVGDKKSAHDFRFVFMFNRAVPWRYREQILERLIIQLSAL